MSTESRRRISSEKVPHVRVENQQGILERYEVDKLLGKGSFGKVYEITERKTGSKWACKKISKEKVCYCKSDVLFLHSYYYFIFALTIFLPLKLIRAVCGKCKL
jgi:hypothetical protein